ncbi:SDR family NAD(P)-dependent oxidoreductase [Ferrimonas pelagia]|uniref:SDR family oxidoreductase n=1 Tax=Ferrimonas pelagia TaxID=1177826 RepID=A0ABP9FCG7_9GAMM
MKRVLITGASSGIGAQLARDYADSGWQVVACGRDSARLAQIQQHSARIETLAFDATEPEAVQTAMASLTSMPDLIILNAGNCEYIERGQIDAALFRRVFDINLFGVLHVIEALQSRFVAGTHLVLVGSSAAYMPLPRAEAYGASKAALAYLAHTLAVDLAAQQVDVSLVCPGFVATPLTDKNDFAMPMRVSVEVASQAMRRGIAQRRSEIHFPRRFTGLLKLIRLLPIGWQRALALRMTGSNR